MLARPFATVLSLVVATAGPGPRYAAAQQAAALDTSFVRHVAQMARQRAAALAVAPTQPENSRAVQQYREALADLDRGSWRDALTTLLAVLQRAPQNPMYRGDLAYTYLRVGQLDPAATEYTRAYQGQQQNGWYVLGIAMVRAAQRQFADAAGAVDLATQSDSSVVDSSVASTAAGWFEAAGDRTRALSWARTSSQRWPGDAQSWLRVASYLMARNDTTPEGITAIRRYLTLRPAEKLGSAIYANYLYVAGQNDSAMALAEYAASDSSYRPFAAQMFLAAGRTLLVRRDVDGALRVLAKGQLWADSSQRTSFNLYVGRAQLLQVSSALSNYEERHTCELAHVADSLTTAAESNLRAGLKVDSARTQQLLDQVLPTYKANSQAAVRGCQAASAPAPPRRGRPRPAQPARPRP